MSRRATDTEAKLKHLYDAIEKGVIEVTRPVAQRIAELIATRGPDRRRCRAHSGAYRQVRPAITPKMLQAFAGAPHKCSGR